MKSMQIPGFLAAGIHITTGENQMSKRKVENELGKHPKGMIHLPETSFRNWLEENTVSENWPFIKKAALAGSLGLSILPFAMPNKQTMPPVAAREIPSDDPGSIKIREEAKDQNLYYDPLTMKKLVKLANEGDEWAIRELAWPEGHPYHKKGRPFFKNTKPHPKGLIKHSGYD